MKTPNMMTPRCSLTRDMAAGHPGRASQPGKAPVPKSRRIPCKGPVFYGGAVVELAESKVLRFCSVVLRRLVETQWGKIAAVVVICAANTGRAFSLRGCYVGSAKYLSSSVNKLKASKLTRALSETCLKSREGRWGAGRKKEG